MSNSMRKMMKMSMLEILIVNINFKIKTIIYELWIVFSILICFSKNLGLTKWHLKTRLGYLQLIYPRHLWSSFCSNFLFLNSRTLCREKRTILPTEHTWGHSQEQTQIKKKSQIQLFRRSNRIKLGFVWRKWRSRWRGGWGTRYFTFSKH